MLFRWKLAISYKNKTTRGTRYYEAKMQTDSFVEKGQNKNYSIWFNHLLLTCAFFICTLIRDYCKNHLSSDIVWIILLSIAATIITIISIRNFKSILSFPDWKLVIDQKGIYSMDKVGEFRVEWMYIEKIIFVYWEGKVLSMEVITSIGKHKEIDLSLIELYASPLKKTISTFSCGKCEMVFVKLYGEYGKNKALSKGNLVHTHKDKKRRSHS